MCVLSAKLIFPLICHAGRRGEYSKLQCVQAGQRLGRLGQKEKRGCCGLCERQSQVLDVYRSNLYEFTALTVLLPSDHIMLICGLYNPPNHSYRDLDLINYIISFVELVLNKHPEAAFVCGGNVNRFDMQEFKALSG